MDVIRLPVFKKRLSLFRGSSKPAFVTRIPIRLPQRSTVEAVVTELCIELHSQVVGVVLCGSLADGKGSDNSDIDLVVLIDGGWHQRRLLRRDAYSVDVFIRDVKDLCEKMREGRFNSIAQMLSTGSILYQRDTLAQQAMVVAQKVMGRRRHIREDTIMEHRMTIIGYLETLSKFTEADRANCAFIAGRLVNYCIELRNALNGTWDAPHKRRLDFIKHDDPELYGLITHALDGETVVAQVAAAYAAAEHVAGSALLQEDNVGPRLPT